MNPLARLFAAEFEPWNIELPESDVAEKRRGEIRKAGWAIQYQFGSDAGREYLDYYAIHRMTNDRHVRLYADGTTVLLPALPDLRPASADPAEDARLQAEYDAEVRRISALLRDKGFTA
jgi:hypothetical protein